MSAAKLLIDFALDLAQEHPECMAKPDPFSTINRASSPLS